MASVQQEAVPSGVVADPSHHYAWFVVVVLTLAYITAFVDRQILSLLVEPIRRDLDISDTQFSLLSGFAFALFYSLMGLPLGRLVDTTHRVRLITIGITLWSLMTALCGLSKNFLQLFVARMGVGIGEATLSPGAYSLIADYFPPKSLGRAISVYVMASSIGSGVAMMIGGGVVGALSEAASVSLGPLGEVRAWQLAFIVVGLPGLLIAVIVAMLREPKRQGLLPGSGAECEKRQALPIRQVLQFFRSRSRTYLPHFLGFSILGMFAFGTLAWVPVFFIRRFGWDASDAGYALGMILLVCGTAGIVAGGVFSDRLRRRGYADAYFRVTLLACCIMLPMAVIGPLMPTAEGAMTCLAVATFFMFVPSAAGPAAIQAVTPNQFRGQITALYSCVGNLLGIACGPTMVALATDYVFRNDLAVGKSLSLIAGLAIPLGAAALLFGLKDFGKQVEAAAAWDERA